MRGRKAGRSTGNYEVGWGKPPKSSQFKPGQSGNPTGRKKKKTPKNMASVFSKMLDDKINVREGDQIRSVSALEAMILSIRKKALEGNTRAISLYLRLAEQAGRLVEEEPGSRGGLFAVPVRSRTTEEFMARAAEANRRSEAEAAQRAKEEQEVKKNQ